MFIIFGSDFIASYQSAKKHKIDFMQHQNLFFIMYVLFVMYDLNEVDIIRITQWAKFSLKVTSFV